MATHSEITLGQLMLMGLQQTFKAVRWLCLLLNLSLAAKAQVSLDPIQVDPQHFKVEYEDAHIRVLRFHLLPGEKSPMHDQAAGSRVTLTNAKVRLTFEDGTLQEAVSIAGAASHMDAMRHAVENIGDTIFETVSTEFKDQGYLAQAPSGDLPVVSTKPPPVIRTPAPYNVPPPSEQVPTRTPQSQPAAANQPQQAPPNPSRQTRSVEGQTAASSPAPLQRETADGIVKAISINGTELAYIDRGQGPLVVLLHDTLGDYRSWLNSVETLAQHFRVVSYSRRYHYPNYSIGKERDYTFQQNAKDLTDFIRTLNAGPAHLVGAAYGSSLAALAALKNPELVRSMVLIDPEFVDFLPPARAEVARATRQEIYRIIRKPLNKGQTDAAIQIFVDWGKGSGTWEHFTAETRSQYKQNANALKAQTYDAPSAAFSCSDAHNIKVPTLLIAGKIAPPNAHDIETVLGSCIANAQKLLVPNREYVGHGVDAIALADFLAKQR